MSTDPFRDEKLAAMLEGSKAFKDELPRRSPYEHKSGLEYAHVAWLTGWDDGEYEMKNGLVHIAGQMSGGLQHCVICGVILTDNRNACAIIVPGEPSPLDSGWAEGPVTVVKCGVRTDYSSGESKRVPHCTSL